MKLSFGLRSRLLIGVTLLVLVAVASSGGTALLAARGHMMRAQDRHAVPFAEQIASVMSLAVTPHGDLADPLGHEAATRVASYFRKAPGVENVVVYDAKGHAVIGTVPDGAGEVKPGRVAYASRESGAIVVYVPLASESRALGTLRVELAGEHEVDSAINVSRTLLFATTALNITFVVLFGAAFIRRIVQPLTALVKQAERVAGGDLDLPPVAGAGDDDEVAHLTDAFNRMTASLRNQRDTLLAQEKLATVGRLAAGVAHEVGNPLTAVLGYVDLLLADPVPEGDTAAAARRDLLDRMRRETTRITGIISDLLDYSRPIADQVEAVPLAALVAGATALMRPQARFREVEFVSEIGEDLPPVRASAGRLTQVVVNLMLNAADAMNGKGKITFRARKVADMVTLSVSDTGPGIPIADRQRIFDPFFTTKEPGKGTGLGLAICRSIVEAYGGTLKVVGAEGEPATFEIRLKKFVEVPPSV